MSRTTASDRARRILSIVPWVAERDGPTVAEICERFEISRADLVADLDVVFMVGTPPYTPDSLIDVTIEDERVWVNLGDYFRRPMRLVPSEALTLLAAGRASLATPGADVDGPLSRALDKVAASLGRSDDDDETIGVDLGAVEPETLEVVRRGVAEHRRLEIDYYSFGKDEHAVRQVDGYRVSNQDGNWYLLAFCHLAQAERVFRVDRIESARLLDDTFEPPAEPSNAVTFSPGPDAPRVTLRVQPAAAWVVEYFPHERAEALNDGSWDVTLAVTALPWLARLLLRLGPDAALVSVDGASPEVTAAIEASRADTARRILARYRD
jgi:proteasome accessory factor C